MESRRVAKSKAVAARTHRDLVAWQVSMQLVADVYQLAAHLPAAERYGIATQIRRAAVSVPVNIAEGFGRSTRREFSRFLAIAQGSLREVQTILEVIVMLEYFALAEVGSATNAANRVGFLLHRLRRSLKREP